VPLCVFLRRRTAGVRGHVPDSFRDLKPEIRNVAVP
jgi:hypothetical protein